MDTTTLKKLVKIDSEIRKGKGAPILFAAFLRTDILGDNNEERWDLLFSASWAKSVRVAHEYIFSKLVKNFKPNELAAFLKKLYILSSKDGFIKEVTTELGNIENRVVLKEPLEIGTGKKTLKVRKAYIFSSSVGAGKAKLKSQSTIKARKKARPGKGIEVGENPKALGKVSLTKAGQ